MKASVNSRNRIDRFCVIIICWLIRVTEAWQLETTTV